MTRDAVFMRAQLASVGIVLDEPRPSAASWPTVVPRADPAVDRDLISEILVGRGASDRDLEWLVASCPSVDDALGYQAPIALGDEP